MGMVGPAGVEPASFRLKGGSSDHYATDPILYYGRI